MRLYDESKQTMSARLSRAVPHLARNANQPSSSCAGCPKGATQSRTSVDRDDNADVDEAVKVKDPTEVLEALYAKHGLVVSDDEHSQLAQRAFCYANHARERRADDSVSRLIEHGCGPLNDANGKSLYESLRIRAYTVCRLHVSGSAYPDQRFACSDDIAQQVALTRERTFLVGRNDVNSIAAACGVQWDTQRTQGFRERLEQRRLILRGRMFDERSAVRAGSRLWATWGMNIGDPDEIFREGVEVGLSDVQATCIAHRTLLTPFL